MEDTARSSLTLRLPPALKGWLEDEATANCRSMNAEIVFRLEQSRAATSDREGLATQSPAAGLTTIA